MRDWVTILTIITSSFAVIGAVFGFFKWFMSRFNKRFEIVDARFEIVDARFERMEIKMDARFEMLENRIFQLAMGKSLKEIMIEERDGK